jgi:hypothetical protein
MPEIGMSVSMSGDGKRGVGHRPQATAPILDSTIGLTTAAGRGVCLLGYTRRRSDAIAGRGAVEKFHRWLGPRRGRLTDFIPRPSAVDEVACKHDILVHVTATETGCAGAAAAWNMRYGKRSPCFESTF